MTTFQADAYLELLTPPRAALLKKSAALARQLHSQSIYRDVTYEELAVEIAVRPPHQDTEVLGELTFLVDGQPFPGDGTFGQGGSSCHGKSNASLKRSDCLMRST